MSPVQSPRRREVGRRGDALVATIAYAALAVAFTWPLAKGLARDVPGDFGDPLLNAWTLAWDARHLLAALGGHVGALREYWQANIFYPHPLALAYSEHLTAQAIEILPVYALTHDPLLCYNLLFLSTFVLSGLGAYLLARELTHSRTAAFVGGVAFGFAPYRFGTLAHVQVLSSAWMPFTLYALHRYFGHESRGFNSELTEPTENTISHSVRSVGSVFNQRRVRKDPACKWPVGRFPALAGAVAAFVAQALSCGYYLMYFTPVVVLFVAWDVHRTRRWRDRAMWVQLALAGAVTIGLVLPFLIPYLDVRRLGVLPRSIDEVDHFAANVYAYFTADVHSWLWGRIARAWPRPEGSLFPGVTIAALAWTAALAAWRTSRRPRDERAIIRLLAWSLAAVTMLGLAILARGGLRFALGPIPFRATDLDRVIAAAAVLSAALLAASRQARETLAAWARTPAGIFAVVLVFAIVMSFGPHIHSRDRLVDDASLYLWFFRHVPGFDGLRVPARFGMIGTLALAMLAADAIARISSTGGEAGSGKTGSAGQTGERPRTRSNGTARRLTIGGVAAMLIALESFGAPIDINYADPVFAHPGLVAVTDGVGTIPPIYDAVRRTPADAVIAELPLGEPAFDARAMFFSTSHWRRLVNGYSGSVPVEYALLAEDVNDLFRSPGRAWSALARSGATYILVHEAAYAGDRGPRVSAWVAARGAHEVARAGTDRLFALPSQQR